jgi:hypothetical protein
MACAYTFLATVASTNNALIVVWITMPSLALSCIMVSTRSISSRHYYCAKSYVRSRNVCIGSSVWFIALFVGGIASVVWLLPWWFVWRGGTIYNVDATATSWIASSTAPQFGKY